MTGFNSGRWKVLRNIKFFICILILASTAGAGSHADINSKIQKVEKDIAESNTEYDALNREIEDINNELDNLSNMKKQTSSGINYLAGKLRKLTKKIRLLTKNYNGYNTRLKKLISDMNKNKLKLSAAEKFISGNAGSEAAAEASELKTPVLFIEDYDTAFEGRIRSYLIRDMLEKTSAFVERSSGRGKELREQTDKVKKITASLKTNLSTLSYRISKNKQLRKTYEKNLRKMREKEKKLEKQRKQKKENKKKLDALIDKFLRRKKNLLAEKEKMKIFISQRGSFPWPVTGRITAHFGRVKHPKLDTYIINRGIKIKASTSTVRAIRSGEISFAGLFKGYGKTVIIDHGGDFFTVTSFLKNVSARAGQKIKSGRIIGTCEPGSEVYFEIRRAGAPENPALWLKKI